MLYLYIQKENTALSFEWDVDKALSNEAKHGVSFEEASDVFLDPQAITYEDTRFAYPEHRYLTVGYSGKQRMLTVVYAETGENHAEQIKLISARRATRGEMETYFN